MRRCLFLLLLLLAPPVGLGAAWTPLASAGTYDVFSCYAGTDSFRNPAANASAWRKIDEANHFQAFDQCGASENGMGIIARGGHMAANGAVGEGEFGAPADRKSVV